MAMWKKYTGWDPGTSLKEAEGQVPEEVQGAAAPLEAAQGSNREAKLTATTRTLHVAAQRGTEVRA